MPTSCRLHFSEMVSEFLAGITVHLRERAWNAFT
jgi:hypothetical protein